jgi:dolichol-phosphate mannosyltransferase
MISVIVPTFNESNNISSLVERISQSLKKEIYEIIVVDDNSPDGTYKIAVSLKKKYPVKAILRKDEKGLSSAVLRGFGEAKGDIWGVIDADLQHPPEKIPELIAEIRNGSDIVVGSRLVKGGGVELWPWYRRVVSFGARIIAIPLTDVRDTMSGFFFLKKEVIQGVILNPIGYKILLEILVKGRYKRVKEVPYMFMNRSFGQSKLSSKVYAHYLMHVARLYKHKFRGISR